MNLSLFPCLECVSWVFVCSVFFLKDGLFLPAFFQPKSIPSSAKQANQAEFHNQLFELPTTTENIGDSLPHIHACSCTQFELN